MTPLALNLPLFLPDHKKETLLTVSAPGDEGVLVLVVHTDETDTLTKLASRYFAPGDLDPLTIKVPEALGGASENRFMSGTGDGLALVVIPGAKEVTPEDLLAIHARGWGLTGPGPFPPELLLSLSGGASFKADGGWQGAHTLHESEIGGVLEILRLPAGTGVTRLAVVAQIRPSESEADRLAYAPVGVRGNRAAVGREEWRTVDGREVLVIHLDALADAEGGPQDRLVLFYSEGRPAEPQRFQLEVGGTASVEVATLKSVLTVEATKNGPVITAVGPSTTAFRQATVDASGEPTFRSISVEALLPRIQREAEAAERDQERQKKANPLVRSGSGRTTEVVPNGPWALILPEAEKEEMLRRLKPLIDHRAEQWIVLEPFIFPTLSPEDDVEEATTRWLESHRHVLSKAMYLLIAGSVPALPFTLEHRLGPSKHLGRLSFEDPDQYDAYAEKVVRMETAHPELPCWPRTLALAPNHPPPADRSAEGIFEPIAPYLEKLSNVKRFVKEAALWEALGPELRETEPALLTFFGHGVGPGTQGATAAPEQVGDLKDARGSSLGASDLPESPFLNRGIAFLFACYGGAWQDQDDIDPRTERRRGEDPSARLSALCQALLAHPEGPLGVIAHRGPIRESGLHDSLGREAFGSSHPTVIAIRQTLIRLLKGRPLGVAVQAVRGAGEEARMALGGETRTVVQARRGALPVELTERVIPLFAQMVDGLNWLALGDPRVALGGSQGRATPTSYRSFDDS